LNFCEISGRGPVGGGLDGLKAKLNLPDEFPGLAGPVGGALLAGPLGGPSSGSFGSGSLLSESEGCKDLLFMSSALTSLGSREASGR
jgi:hypothetical protein